MTSLTRSRLFALLVLVLGTLFGSTGMRSAHAGSELDDDGAKPPGSYASILFQGGVLVPLGTTEAVFQDSLAGGGRIGWTSRVGLGFDVALDYSPLSRKPGQAQDAFETHYVTASLMPRFTLGKRVVRVWVAGGGGLAFERTKPGSGEAPPSNQYAVVAAGAAGLELHVVSGLGLAVIGSYQRTYFGEVERELATVTGGLAFTL